MNPNRRILRYDGWGILDKNKSPKGMNGMNMYFSARTQTLAQFKEAYDNGKNPELVLYKKR